MRSKHTGVSLKYQPPVNIEQNTPPDGVFCFAVLTITLKVRIGKRMIMLVSMPLSSPHNPSPVLGVTHRAKAHVTMTATGDDSLITAAEKLARELSLFLLEILGKKQTSILLSCLKQEKQSQ